MVWEEQAWIPGLKSNSFSGAVQARRLLPTAFRRTEGFLCWAAAGSPGWCEARFRMSSESLPAGYSVPVVGLFRHGQHLFSSKNARTLNHLLQDLSKKALE